MQAMVADALAANRFFAMAAMPRTMRPILFSRYTAGMSYGPHVDNALMGDAPQTRIDLAFTLFLSDPDSYEGGELEIEEPEGPRSFQLPAGEAIPYTANSVPEVAQVTSGRRHVARGWGHSPVTADAQRPKKQTV